MRNFIGAALVMTIGTSLFGCVEPESTDAPNPEQAPLPHTLGTHGSIGSNGLSSDDFMSLQVTLAKAARESALVDPGTNTLTNYIQHWFLQSKAGKSVLSYAVACTVPDGVKVSYLDDSFIGAGHLSNGSAWLNGPLPHATINELMACMAAHVNAFNVTVPILLLGPHVLDDPIEHPKFSVSEALWKADVNADDVPSYTVWPSDYVAQNCVDVLSAFRNRVCGQWSVGCNFSVGTPGACTPALHNPDGDFSCNGIPVIETRLAPDDPALLYPYCHH